MPRITVAPHTPALAADFNTVSDQSVMSFPTAAARTAAIPTPGDGMLTHLADADRLELRKAAQWVPVALGPVVVAKRTSTAIAAASGGQTQIQFSGFAAPPVASVVLENPAGDNYNLIIAGGPTASTLNVFVVASNTSAPAPDGLMVTLHVILVGPAIPGEMPTITSAAAP